MIWQSESTPLCPPKLDALYERERFIFHSTVSLVKALAYLHSNIHRRWCGHFDIKPRNVLPFQDDSGHWMWKLADFGLSALKSIKDPGTTSEIGSDQYQPPEFREKPTETKHGPSFDVFSMGCVLLQFATLAIFAWKKNKVRTLKNSLAEVEGGTKKFIFRAPGVVGKWNDRLKRATKDPKVLAMLETAQHMLASEPKDRSYAFDAVIDFIESFRPQMDDAELKSECREILQGQGPDPKFGHFYDPILRVIRTTKSPRNNFVNIRKQHLIKASWPDRPEASFNVCDTSSVEHAQCLSTLPSRY